MKHSKNKKVSPLPRSRKSGTKNAGRNIEQLRKQAITDADRNIAAIEAAERGEKPKAMTATKLVKLPKGSAAKSHPRPRMKDKKLSGLDAAARILTQSKEPLNAATIAERAIAAGWKTNGKTPHATLYSAMIREIATKGKDSRFKKTERGLFTIAKTRSAASESPF